MREKKWYPQKTVSTIKRLANNDLIKVTLQGQRKPWVTTDKGMRVFRYFMQYAEKIEHSIEAQKTRERDQDFEEHMKLHMLRYFIASARRWRQQAERLKADLDAQLNEQMQRAWREANPGQEPKLNETVTAAPSEPLAPSALVVSESPELRAAVEAERERMLGTVKPTPSSDEVPPEWFEGAERHRPRKRRDLTQSK